MQVLFCLALFWGCATQALAQTTSQRSEAEAGNGQATAVFAGGCFWCVETDFEKLPAVTSVVSGYSGGRTSRPSYDNYASGGHREVVLVEYSPSQITFAGLVEYLLKHIDPTDQRGQFNDRGLQYSPAIYVADAQEKEAAEKVIQQLNEQDVFKGKKIGVAILPRTTFWPAEEYHQDYHTKNGIKYNFFRLSSGRDKFIQSHWGDRAGKLELPGAYPVGADSGNPGAAEAENAPPPKWLAFRKPTPVELRKKLTPLQYQVTQREGTEPAFRNAYWDNKKQGIYVDIVSGAPLFSSMDKYKSGTGWPSFVAPISPDALTLHTDRKLFYTRVEVRSRIGDSHLGHVFNDGPPARGGKRYCMNSAALRFVPKEKMAEEGYGDFLSLFE